MKKTIPNRAANIRKPAALPEENALDRNSLTGSIGSAARSSQATNAAASTAPAASDMITPGLDQPRLFARISPHTRPSAPPVASISPAGSRLARPPALAPIRASTSGIITRPSGMFSQKIHCQDSPWATAPPITGPASTARPVTLLKMPSAQARRWGGNAALSSASDSGSTSAAPAPCTARAVISAPASGDSAHAADAAVNSPRPAASRRGRPSRSPSAAPVISSTAKLST